MILVYVAFWIIYRAACQSGRIRQTAQELELVFLDGTDGGRRAVLSPHWAWLWDWRISLVGGSPVPDQPGRWNWDPSLSADGESCLGQGVGRRSASMAQ